MAVCVEEKHMTLEGKDMGIQVSEDETELLTSLLELAREGHFSFVYNELTSTKEKSQPHHSNKGNDNIWSVRELDSAEDEKEQTSQNAEGNDNNKQSISSKQNLESSLNKQHSINECIIKLQKLPPELLAKSSNCYIKICKLPVIEKQLLLFKSSLSQRSIEIDSNIGKVHEKYYLTNDEYWKCKLCKIKTKDKNNIIQHVYAHLLLALCRCKICSETFRIKYNIK